LQELAQSICTLQLPEAEAKGIVCLIHFDEALYTPVYTDAYLLRRILSNLISNAIKYTQAGQIEVRFETGARTAPDSLPLIITIADTGIGMDKDLLEQLFEPFIQAQSHRYQSTGLGLAIVKGIVDSMQGQIRVASKPGLGSSFVIELQLATSPQPLAVAADNAESVTLDLTGIRILVVDDSPINQRLLQVLLEMQGATIKTCATGQAALDAMQADAIDIILLDIHLPDSQGVELSQQLHAVPGCASIPIIALTADMIAMENMRNVSPHIQQWLGKPFDETELLQAIASALQLSLTARSDNSADSQLGQDDDRQVKLLAMRQELRAQLQQELPAAIAELHAQLSTNARDAFAAGLHRLKGAAAVARHQRLHDALAEVEEQLSKNADSATLLIQLEQLRLLLD
jgi:CheY-like chemotaxis protein/anti-sigma regulatory factor (Ser/Thr protein kinase)